MHRRRVDDGGLVPRSSSREQGCCAARQRVVSSQNYGQMLGLRRTGARRQYGSKRILSRSHVSAAQTTKSAVSAGRIQMACSPDIGIIFRGRISSFLAQGAMITCIVAHSTKAICRVGFRTGLARGRQYKQTKGPGTNYASHAGALHPARQLPVQMTSSCPPSGVDG